MEITYRSDAEMQKIDSTFDPSCASCNFHREAGCTFYPPHRSACQDRCKSGGRPHCSCDTCF